MKISWHMLKLWQMTKWVLLLGHSADRKLASVANDKQD